MIGLDTNVLVRYLTQDDPAQSAHANAFIDEKLSPSEPGIIGHIVLCKAIGTSTIVTTEAPTGPMADALKQLSVELAQDGIEIITLRRPWDDLAWPHATHGFFRFRRQIPELIIQNGLNPLQNAD